MTANPAQPPASTARRQVLTALAALRGRLPLEQRCATAPLATRSDYAQLLRNWLNAGADTLDAVPAPIVDRLCELSLCERTATGLLAYPLVSAPPGQHVALAGRSLRAVDLLAALAVARLAGAAVLIDTHCQSCGRALRLPMAADGSLDHEHADLCRISWPAQATAAAAQHAWCPRCGAPDDSLTLPQAAAVAHAFCGFQYRLLRAGRTK